MQTGRYLAAAAALAIAIGLGVIGVTAYRRAQPEVCHACRRPIHMHSRTVAQVGGEARTFCCPACAFSEQQQEGKTIRVTELTAFATGAKLAPDNAWVVRGSDINMCAQTHELLDSEKRAAEVLYDRCAPSLLAFPGKAEAVEFSRRHGGEVLPFAAAVAALRR